MGQAILQSVLSSRITRAVLTPAMLLLLSLVALSALAYPSLAVPQSWGTWSPAKPPYKYVIALSVDGLHSSDVAKYVTLRPQSAIAGLLSSGIEYQNAWTSAV